MSSTCIFEPNSGNKRFRTACTHFTVGNDTQAIRVMGEILADPRSSEQMRLMCNIKIATHLVSEQSLGAERYLLDAEQNCLKLISYPLPTWRNRDTHAYILDNARQHLHRIRSSIDAMYTQKGVERPSYLVKGMPAEKLVLSQNTASGQVDPDAMDWEPTSGG